MREYHLKKPILGSLGAEVQESKLPPQPPHNRPSIWQRLQQPWDNLNFRTKLAILLLASAALPVIVVTQGLLTITKENTNLNIKQSLHKEGTAFVEDYVSWGVYEAQTEADTVAQIVETNQIDLSDPKQVANRRQVLLSFINNLKVGEDTGSVEKNIRIVTDAQGRSVLQNIQTLAADYYNLPANKTEINAHYRTVSLPLGTYLGDIPIVKNALKTGKTLSGMELIKSDILKRLGQDQQANIGLHPQPTNSLPESEQPFPPGTYDIDGGRAALVGMAVRPVKIGNKLVGTVIVGYLANHNPVLVDAPRSRLSQSFSAVFAQDWQVSSNIPATDGKTRDIGARAERKVADTVLNQGKEFFGSTKIGGVNYLGFYKPMYDHQQQLNPEAKPVGMAFVGEPLANADSLLKKQQLTAYGIGGEMLLLVGLFAIPIAGSFSRPLKRLAGFAQAVGVGEEGLRLETGRSDEIGILAQELNQMAANIEANLEIRRQEAERANFFTNIASFDKSESQALKSIFDKALTGARAILKADRIVVYRFNPGWSGFIAAESVLPHWPSALNDKIEDACIGEELIEAYKQGRFVPTNNVFEAGFHPDHLRLMERLKIKANLVTPIVNNDKLYGLLIAHHCAAPHKWQLLEIDFLRQLAVQLGLILDRESLLEQRQLEAERAKIVKDITVRLSQISQMQEIFNTAVKEIRTAIKSDRVVVYSFDQNWKGTVIAESVANGWQSALGAQIADPCFADKYVNKYLQGRVQATENIYKAGLTECHIKQLEPFAVKANLVAPILQAGKLLGLLIAHQCSAPRAWQQGETDLFAQLATQVGLALDRFQLLEQQKNAKDLLQRRALELLIEVDPVSRGDLTVRANVTEDEIGTIADSYNATINSLRKIVTQVQAAATQVTFTTTNSEGAVEGLSQETLRQAEEIAVALEQIQEMSVSITAVEQSAQQAEAAVQQATQTVAAGDAAMNRTVNSMVTIRETVVETSKKVKQLGESSQKISKVVSLIGRFAAQTNLLALKASIEAARAGEEGRGFAVLADEVRVLARQSAEATSEIESLIANIQTETNAVVAAMEAGKEQVVTGTKLVDETRQSLNKITDVSQQLGELVAAIASAAAAQSQASQLVTTTMTDVAQIASHTNSEVTVVSASFQELLALAQELQASAGQFKVS